MLSPEVWSALATAAASALGYALSELRRKRIVRLRRVQVLRESERREHNFTISVDEAMKLSFNAQIRESIQQHLGALRRDVTEHMGALEVLVRDAIGRTTQERELARQDRRTSVEAKEAIRAEVMGLRKATEHLTSAAGEILSTLQRVEKFWS